MSLDATFIVEESTIEMMLGMKKEERLNFLTGSGEEGIFINYICGIKDYEAKDIV